MDDNNKKAKKLINLLNNENERKIKVFHSSFSKEKEFNKENTFKEYDFRSFGAFHGACDDLLDTGKSIAENRVFVKIVEELSSLNKISPQKANEIFNSDSLSLEILEDITNQKIDDKYKNPIMIELDISYKKAFTLDEGRLGQWNPHDILMAVMDEVTEKIENGSEVEGFSEQDVEDYMSDEMHVNNIKMVDLDYENYAGEEINQEYKEFLFVRDWLASKGYDAIIYENKFEGSGNCIISLDNKNIEVTNSYSLADNVVHYKNDINEEQKIEIKKKKSNTLKMK